MVERLKCTIMRRKKSPHILCRQAMRITNYLMCESWKDGVPSKEVRRKVLEKVKKIESIYTRYVDNIYKLHNMEMNGSDEANHVWLYSYHTNKEYMNI